MLTHAELKKKALANSKIRAEYERLNREEFAILDEILAARREGLSLATTPPASGVCQ